MPSRLYDAGLHVYGEVGVATRLAVLAGFQLLRGLSLAPESPGSGAGTTALGIGDLDAGLRLLLFDEEVTCSLQATLGIPTGRSDASLPLGTGDLRGAFVLSVGRVGARVPLFFSVDLGGNIRGSGRQRAMGLVGDGTTVTIDYASELLYAGELGYLVSREPRGRRVRLSPRVRLDGRYGTRAPTTPTAAALVEAPIAPESVRFVRLSAALGVEIAVGRPSRSTPITSLIIDLSGGAFVWGEGLPAAGQASLAFGIKR